eukprot:EG_transcript_5762
MQTGFSGTYLAVQRLTPSRSSSSSSLSSYGLRPKKPSETVLDRRPSPSSSRALSPFRYTTDVAVDGEFVTTLRPTLVAALNSASSLPPMDGVRLHRSRSLPPAKMHQQQVMAAMEACLEREPAVDTAEVSGPQKPLSPIVAAQVPSDGRRSPSVTSPRRLSPSTRRRPSGPASNRKPTDPPPLTVPRAVAPGAMTITLTAPTVQSQPTADTEPMSPWEPRLREVETALRAKVATVPAASIADLFGRVHRCIAGGGEEDDDLSSSDEEVAQLERENERLMVVLAQQKAQLRSLLPMAFTSPRDLPATPTETPRSNSGSREAPPAAAADVTAELRCQVIECESRLHRAEARSVTARTMSPTEEEALPKLQLARTMQEFHCIRALMAGETFLLEVQCKRVPDFPLLLKIIPGYKAEGSSRAHQANLHEFRLLRTVITPSEFILPCYHYFVETPERVAAAWPAAEAPPTLPPVDALCLLLPATPFAIGRLAHCYREQTGQSNLPDRFVLWCLLQTLRGLQHLHSCRLLHGAIGEHAVMVHLVGDRPAPIGALLNAIANDPFSLQFRLRDFRKSMELGRAGREKDDVAALGALTRSLCDGAAGGPVRSVVRGLTHPDPSRRWSVTVALTVVGAALFGPTAALPSPHEDGARLFDVSLSTTQKWLARARQ